MVIEPGSCSNWRLFKLCARCFTPSPTATPSHIQYMDNIKIALLSVLIVLFSEFSVERSSYSCRQSDNTQTWDHEMRTDVTCICVQMARAIHFVYASGALVILVLFIIQFLKSTILNWSFSFVDTKSMKSWWGVEAKRQVWIIQDKF